MHFIVLQFVGNYSLEDFRKTREEGKITDYNWERADMFVPSVITMQTIMSYSSIPMALAYLRWPSVAHAYTPHALIYLLLMSFQPVTGSAL